MLEHLPLAIILIGIVAFASQSQRIERSLLTLPMIFTGFGWAIGRGGAELVPMQDAHGLIHSLAEITLIILLFAEASCIGLRKLASDFALPGRMILIGMPLTILLGTLLALLVFPEAPWPLALLVAAILTPTDAALGQAVVTSPTVPQRLRQAIKVEAGLNDGLAVPVIIVAAMLAATATGTAIEQAPDNLYVFVALQIVLGPLTGLGVGWLFAKLLDRSIDTGHITTAFQGIYFLCTALLTFVVAESVGGNGLIAAFVGGLVFGHVLQHPRDFVDEFMEGEGQLLTILTFVTLGAVLVPLALENATWGTVVLAFLYLSIIRMLPVWLSLSGTDLSSYDKLFLGWFGPRGLPSVLFALLILERFPVPGAEEMLACVVLTVLLSIFLHGLSANPLSDRFMKERG